MKKKKKSISYGKWGQIFILPFFIIYFIFSLIPLADTVRYSFYEYYRSGIKEVGPNFVGMANYISLLKSDMLALWKKHADSVADRFYPADCDRTCSCELVYGCQIKDTSQTIF